MITIRRAAILTAFGAAFGFALFLVVVVVLANTGQVGAVFGWLYNFPYGDKVGHFLLMGTLSFLVSLGFPTRRVKILARPVLKSSLIIAAVVTVEEWSQAFFPGRSASLLDLAASLAGITLFGEAGAWLRQRIWAGDKHASESLNSR